MSDENSLALDNSAHTSLAFEWGRFLPVRGMNDSLARLTVNSTLFPPASAGLSLALL